MFRIAIVDDLPSESGTLKGYCERYGSEYGVPLEVTVFCEAYSFLESRTACFDIILMDIAMPGMNGMEAARALRKTNSTSTLIFVTTMMQFAVNGYEVGALDFVVKPVTYAQFAMKFRRGLENARQHAGEIVSISAGADLWQISTADIVYVEVQGHNAIYHTTREMLRCRDSLSAVETRLKSSHFLRCNACYLINPRHLRSVSGYEVEMDDGSKLLISHPRRKQFLQELAAYMGR